MDRIESHFASGLTILLLSCGLAVGMALLQDGLALATHGDSRTGRGVVWVAIGAIVVGCDLTGIARFLNPPREDD